MHTGTTREAAARRRLACSLPDVFFLKRLGAPTAGIAVGKLDRSGLLAGRRQIPCPWLQRSRRHALDRVEPLTIEPDAEE